MNGIVGYKNICHDTPEGWHTSWQSFESLCKLNEDRQLERPARCRCLLLLPPIGVRERVLFNLPDKSAAPAELIRPTAFG
jgi:hypothetical protein